MFGYFGGWNCGYSYSWPVAKPTCGYKTWSCKTKCDDDGEDSILLAGTTNTDGTGSSANLTIDNSNISLVGDGSSVDSEYDTELTHSSDDGGSTYAHTGFWHNRQDSPGYKEIQVNNDDAEVYVDNFVDVDINNTYNCGSEITVVNAKRGQIDTGRGNDTIDVHVLSNNTTSAGHSYANDFSVNSGAGNDTITFHNVDNSEVTSISVDAGKGRDTVDISDLNTKEGVIVTRDIDGGRGRDTLIVDETDYLSFENFEVVIGVDGNDSTLNIDANLLEANSSSRLGLVVSNLDLEFDDGLTISATDDLLWSESRYLDNMGLDSEEFMWVQFETELGTYSVLTDDLDLVA